MVEVALLAALALLTLGVIGSLVPMVPGPLLSLFGIYGYWWSTGYTEPGWVFLLVATLVGLFALTVEFAAGALSAKAGGASWRTTAIASVVGIALFFVTGPVGLLLGVVGTVFALEFWRSQDVERSGRTAVYTTIGMLASTAAQVLLTGVLLAAFVLVVVV